MPVEQNSIKRRFLLLFSKIVTLTEIIQIIWNIINDDFNVFTCWLMDRIQLLSGLEGGGLDFLQLQVCQDPEGHSASYVMIPLERSN
jgi:hypothetical protein